MMAHGLHLGFAQFCESDDEEISGFSIFNCVNIYLFGCKLLQNSNITYIVAF